MARALFNQAEWLGESGQMEAARGLYSIVYENRLPGWQIARNRLPRES
ncbi:MAG: hypothetical protein LR015_08305 [Verrucomicrobia bacterium]|nr:hypothetical protein [Verrucomicrobiota bacterium]